MYEGRFNDGRTAIAHEVVVNLARDGLDIRTVDDAIVLFWRYDDLRLVGGPGDTPLRLTRRSDAAPRLAVADPVFRAALRERAPALEVRRAAVSLRGLGVVAACVAGTALLLAALWFGLPLLARPLAALIPASIEARLGRQVVALAAKDMAACANPEGRAALRRLVDRLAGGVERPIDFQVSVVNRPVVNAFAAPGGHVVIFAGLIEKVESPDEVAGVLAHEMAHIVHRHGMQALIRHFALSTIVTVIAGNDWGVGAVAGGAGQMLLHLAHTREAEAEADATALDILKAARLRGDGLGRFFARLEKTEATSSGPARYLDSHPPLAERRAALERAAAAGAPALNAREWAALKSICRG